MFRWYNDSRCCYVYLSDVTSSDHDQVLGSSRWFTRGWTLQELLAPRRTVFFAQDWIPIGHQTSCRLASSFEDKVNARPCQSLTDKLSTITGIPIDFLVQRKGLEHACVAQRMFWASSRETTREEDRAYSLLGIFDVSLPILYGEGLEKAFTRLQREIMSKTTDQSILAWYRSDASSYRLLAESPDCFRNSGRVLQLGRGGRTTSTAPMNWSSFSMTNLGLRISLPLSCTSPKHELRYGDCAVAQLDAFFEVAHVPPPAPPGTRDLRNISLRMIFLNLDVEGTPVFVCDRLRRFTFADFALVTKPERLTNMFLCGIDYKSAPADGGTAVSSYVKILHIKVPGKQDIRTTGTDADRCDSFVTGVLNVISNEMDLGPFHYADEMRLLDTGIDSLTWIIIVSRIRKETNVDIGIGSLYDYPTFGRLKVYLWALVSVLLDTKDFEGRPFAHGKLRLAVDAVRTQSNSFARSWL
jgi:hypothetical protein